jgi:hypothetical protein
MTTRNRKARSPRRSPQGKVSTSLTHPELTRIFNDLVPAAKKQGIRWAKHHTSAFITKAGGVAQIKRLEKELASARVR